MKRPSAWPLLVILLVIGTGFSLLVFHDRIQSAEQQVADADQLFRDQNNHITRVENELQSAKIEIVRLQTELQAAGDLEEEQNQQIQNLNEELQLITASEPDTALTTLVNSIDTQLTTLWTVTIVISAAFLLEAFFFR